MIGDRNLLLLAARTQRCAGEGKLAFGLTKHGGTIAGGGLSDDWVFACFSAGPYRSERGLESFVSGLLQEESVSRREPGNIEYETSRHSSTGFRYEFPAVQKPHRHCWRAGGFLKWQDAMKNLPAKFSKAAFNPGLDCVRHLTPGALQFEHRDRMSGLCCTRRAGNKVCLGNGETPLCFGLMARSRFGQRPSAGAAA